MYVCVVIIEITTLPYTLVKDSKAPNQKLWPT